MIFVHETRPKIVVDNPSMTALSVMQEVGRRWQSRSNEEKKYFEEKAAQDKIRYLKEQRAYYDEVERLGNTMGTVINHNGFF